MGRSLTVVRFRNQQVGPDNFTYHETDGSNSTVWKVGNGLRSYSQISTDFEMSQVNFLTTFVQMSLLNIGRKSNI